MFPLMLFVPVLITIVIQFVWIILGIRHQSGRYLLGVLPFIAVWAG